MLLAFFHINRKAQQAFIGYLLLVGIVLSLVGAAYMWGEPLIRKNEAKAVISNIEKLALAITEKLEDSIMRRMSHDIILQDVNARIELSNGEILFTVEVPLSVYTSELEFPINVGSYDMPNSFALSVGSTKEIGSIRITAGVSQVIIEDLSANKTLTCTEFPCTAITSLYIFEVYSKNGNYIIVPTGQTGLLGSEPMCVLLAKSEVLGRVQRINYRITCRVLYSFQDNICIFPKVSEKGDVLYTGGKKRLVMQYKGEEENIVGTSGKLVSSVCEIVNIRNIDVEFI